MRARAILLVPLCGAIVACALPATADAYIYWANHGSASIGRANLEGTGVDQGFVANTEIPCQPAVDGAHLYWTDSVSSGSVVRANLDGSGVEQKFVPGGSDTCGVAVDAGHVYWANLGSESIGRANIDGGEADQKFITGAKNPRGVAVDGSHVYWTNSDGTIGRAGLDGKSKKQNFITGANFPCGLAVDAGHIYWGNENGQTIGRANLDGTGVDQNFITGATFPCGPAVDAGHIYWANSANDTSIARADLDGTHVEEKFITGVNGPSGVAVDNLPHPSAMTLACAPSSLVLPSSASCTATVTDNSLPAHPPGGAVAFDATGSLGAFAPTSSCLLVPSGGAAAACQLSYEPATFGIAAIDAAYAGDLANSPTSATTKIRARPSNAFTLGRLKLNKKAGTATLTAKVPGPGRLTLRASKALKGGAARPAAPGTVKLELKPRKTAKKSLARRGRAKVLARVTYVPTGGTAATRSRSVKLIRRRAGRK